MALSRRDLGLALITVAMLGRLNSGGLPAFAAEVSKDPSAAFRAAHAELLRDFVNNVQGNIIPFSLPAVMLSIMPFVLETGDTNAKIAFADLFKASGATTKDVEKIVELIRSLDVNTAGIQVHHSHHFLTDEALPADTPYAEAFSGFGGKEIVVDFTKTDAVMDLINGLVEADTNKVIKKFLSEPLSADTQQVGIGVAYTRWAWEQIFAEAEDVVVPFHGTDGTVNIKSMNDNINGRHATVVNHQKARTILIPLENDDGTSCPFDIAVTVPTNDGNLGTVLDQYGEILRDLVKPGSKDPTSRVVLTMPAFKFGETRFDLKAGLGNSRLKDILAIVDGATIVGAGHVDHKGGEIAVAAEAHTDRSLISTAPRFAVDRPFIVSIRHRRTGITPISVAVKNLAAA